MSEQKYHFETLALHVGQEEADPVTDSRQVPIYLTTSYVFKNSQHAADRFGLADPGNIYGRLTNSTQDVFEKRIAALEGGSAAIATASGAAAVTYAVQALAKAGENIVAAKTIYGGTYNLLAHTLPLYGITAKFADPYKLDEVEAAIDENTKGLWIETLGNPLGNIVDIEAWAEVAHKHHIPTDAYPWLTEPNPSYHGIRFYEATKPAAFVTYIRAILLRDEGATLSPVNAWAFIQGLETLSLRVERHVENALKVVEYLNNHPQVEAVHHPSIEEPELYKKYFPNGGGSIFTFEVKGDAETARKWIDNLPIFSLLANVADVKSLVIHPASTTHSQLTEAEAADQGIYPNTIRLSIGTEHIDDILAALDTAFKAIA